MRGWIWVVLGVGVALAITWAAGTPYALVPVMAGVGLLLFIYGMFGLLFGGLDWLKRAVRWVLPWLTILVVLVPVRGEARTYDTRRVCHTRTMYQAGADWRSTWPGARIWQLRLCVDYEEVEEDGEWYVRAMPPATITWTPLGIYAPMWKAEDCEAWIQPMENGRFNVRGRCKISQSIAPFFGIFDGVWVSRTIWDGFTVGHRYRDYWYPERVDYWNETESDPLPDRDLDNWADEHFHYTWE